MSTTDIESRRGCIVCDVENDAASELDPETRKSIAGRKPWYSESARDEMMARIVSGEAYEDHELAKEEAAYKIEADRREASGRRRSSGPRTDLYNS